MKMILVPYYAAKSRWSKGTYYRAPSGESWSYSPLECDIENIATADDCFAAFDAKIDECLEEANASLEELDCIDCRWSWIRRYKHRVSGFAIVKPEIVAMLDDVHPDVCSDGGGDTISYFMTAFCVKHAEQLIVVWEPEKPQ